MKTAVDSDVATKTEKQQRPRGVDDLPKVTQTQFTELSVGTLTSSFSLFHTLFCNMTVGAGVIV